MPIDDLAPYGDESVKFLTRSGSSGLRYGYATGPLWI